MAHAHRARARPGGTIRAAGSFFAVLLLAACAPFGSCSRAGPVVTGPSASPSPTASPAASLSFTPASVDFHDQIRGPGSSGVFITVHIANSGAGPSVGLGALSVSPSGYVTILNDGCSNQTLAAGAACSVQLSYPAANAPPGPFVGTLVVPDDIPPDRTAKLDLKGNLEQM